MMASSTTTKAPISSTLAGLLTAGEVSARYAEMRRRVNLFIPTSACLFRAMGDLCASAVMGPGGQTWLPESARQQILDRVNNTLIYITMSWINCCRLKLLKLLNELNKLRELDGIYK